MDIGNMHKNLVKIAHVIPEISSRTDRHTDRHRLLIAILRNRSRERSSLITFHVSLKSISHVWLIIVALRNSADHYIFALWFLCILFFFWFTAK